MLQNNVIPSRFTDWLATTVLCSTPFCADFIPPGGFHRYGFIGIITKKDAPAWLAPRRGVADQTRKRKEGMVIIL